MTLDLFTITAVTALVVVVSGVLYLAETLLRKDGTAGRLWSTAFLSGIFTVLCYLVWAASPGAFVAVALGNAGFAGTAGFMWLGCLAFNDRRLWIPAALVTAGMVFAFVSVVLAGPSGGDWAGAVPMFLGVFAFAVAGAIETRRGSLGNQSNALGLTIVLAIEATFFLARIVFFLAVGPDHELFQTWFGSEAASLLTVTLTIVAVVTTSVLRATESGLRGHRDTYTIRIGTDGVMLPASFASAASKLLERASLTQETVCLVAIRVGDLGRVATAFGPADGEAIATAWRSGVRRYAPTAAVVGEHGDTILLIAFVTPSFADVRRTASIIHRRLIDDFAALGTSVVPSVGVGIALTDRLGYDFTTLADAAEAAAERSVTSSDASVIVAEG